MEDQYSNLSVDLRQFINRTNNTTSSQYMQPIPLTPQGVPPLPTVLPDFFTTHQQQQHPSFLNLITPPPFHHQHPYTATVNGRHVTDMLSRVVDVGMNSNGGEGLMTFNHHHHDFGSDSTTATTPNGGTNSGGAATVGANLCGFDVEEGVGGGGNSGGTGSIGGVCIGTGGGGSEAGTARWPRQETLTLLEIRSRLDRKFKEANQKGPLWDEVSRIMYEENGYQRSGKKCREKFENLYKYYKKTKEGKAGRQDGKRYRFFRQLEALYGSEPASTVPLSSTTIPPLSAAAGNTNNSLPAFNHQQMSSCSTHHQITPRQHQLCLCDNSTVSLSNTSSIFHTSSSFSSDDNDDDDDNNYDDDGPNDDLNIAVASSMENNNNSNDNNNNISDRGGKVGMKGGGSSSDTNKRRRKRSNWKGKVKDFLDKQTKKLMEKQESWLERMMKALERKEEERNLREEEWRKQDIERMEQEHKFWATEKAWIEARDAALLDALHKLNDKDEAKLVANEVEQVMLAHQQQRHLLLLQQQAANHHASTGANAATAAHHGDHGSNQQHHHEHHRPAEGWIY